MSDDSALTSSTYEAIGIHDELPRGKSSGVLTVTAQSMSFACEDTQTELPVEGLSFKFGGARNRLIFFSHPDLPEWSIYTSDQSILTHSSFRNHPDLVRESGRLQSENRTALT